MGVSRVRNPSESIDFVDCFTAKQDPEVVWMLLYQRIQTWTVAVKKQHKITSGVARRETIDVFVCQAFNHSDRAASQ